MEKHDQESAVAEGARRATGGGRFSVGRKSAVVMCWHCQLEAVSGRVGRCEARFPATTDTAFHLRSLATLSGYITASA